MLKKQFRLKKKSAFTATYRLKKCVSDKNIIAYLGKEKSEFEIPTKAAFVVSKKVHKRAVKRNRIKRLMRESYRLALKNNELEELQKYLSIIFIARQGALEADYSSIRVSILNLISKLLIK